MKVSLQKSNGKYKCRSLKCKSNPEFISKSGRILKDTTCVYIVSDGASGSCHSYYCKDCLKELLSDLKKVLDPKLWLLQ